MNATSQALDAWQSVDYQNQQPDTFAQQFKPSYVEIPNPSIDSKLKLGQKVVGEQDIEDPEDIQTQEPVETPNEPTKEEPPDMPEEPQVPSGDTGMPSDGMGDTGDETPGMEQEEQGPESPIEVGRLFELKKIHSRLVSIQTFLADTTDADLVEIKKCVSQSVELFRTLISNIKLFTDQLDDIIIMFYEFLDTTHKLLSDYYKTNVDGPTKYVKINRT